MGLSKTNNLTKAFSKPPIPSTEAKPKITIVKVLKPLTEYKTTFFTIEIDNNYAYVTGPYGRAERTKPDWFVHPNTKDFAVWFSQGGCNTVIIYEDKKYQLMSVKKGSRFHHACQAGWCKESLEKGYIEKCPIEHRTSYYRLWVLKPVTLSAESEAWVAKTLAESL